MVRLNYIRLEVQWLIQQYTGLENKEARTQNHQNKAVGATLNQINNLNIFYTVFKYSLIVLFTITKILLLYWISIYCAAR